MFNSTISLGTTSLAILVLIHPVVLELKHAGKETDGQMDGREQPIMCSLHALLARKAYKIKIICTTRPSCSLHIVPW
jgi:hypothetical protein